MFSLEAGRKYGGNANMGMSGKLKSEIETEEMDVQYVQKRKNKKFYTFIKRT